MHSRLILKLAVGFLPFNFLLLIAFSCTKYNDILPGDYILPLTLDKLFPPSATFGPYHLVQSNANNDTYIYDLYLGNERKLTIKNINHVFYDRGDDSIFIQSFHNIDPNALSFYGYDHDCFKNGEYYHYEFNCIGADSAYAAGELYTSGLEYLYRLRTPIEKYDLRPDRIVSNLLSRNNLLIFLVKNTEEKRLYLAILDITCPKALDQCLDKHFLLSTGERFTYHNRCFGPHLVVSADGTWFAFHYDKELFIFNNQDTKKVLVKSFNGTPFALDINDQGQVSFHLFPFNKFDSFPSESFPSWMNELTFFDYTGSDVETIDYHEFTEY